MADDADAEVPGVLSWLRDGGNSPESQDQQSAGTVMASGQAVSPEVVFAEKVKRECPQAPLFTRQAHLSLLRIAERAALDGIDQFADWGCGIPSRFGTVHQAVQTINQLARVVYVDSNPRAVVETRIAAGNTPHILVIEHDIAQLDSLVTALTDTAARTHLDFKRPIMVFLALVTHLLTDEQAVSVMDELYTRLASGSRIVVTAPTSDATDPDLRQKMKNLVDLYWDEIGVRWHLRDQVEFVGLLPPRGSSAKPALMQTWEMYPGLQPRPDASDEDQVAWRNAILVAEIRKP